MVELNKIYNEDCLTFLKQMPDQYVECCITSPPYFGLRDYGMAGQIGLEETPEAYVEKMVAVFREVRRVLKDDGTLWLNLGDSYASNTKGSGGPSSKQDSKAGSRYNPRKFNHGVKEKDLMGIPWMVAFALRADGWYLRQDIIWHKPNPMPESVTDRCTKSHEYIFLLSKSLQYYFDAKAIAEQQQQSSRERLTRGWNGDGDRGYPNGPQNHLKNYMGSFDSVEETPLTRNKRDVWTVTTKPYREAHFATYPPDLIEPCIKAGCPEGGIVLDPFMGAGTTALVAHKLNRNYIGTELNPEYCQIAEKRILPYKLQQKLF